MSGSLGSLFVELGVNTAAFFSGMDKATYKAKESAKAIGESFKGLGHSIGGLMSQFGGMGTVIGEAFSGAGETLAKMSTQFGSVNGAAGVAAIGVAGVAAAAIAASAAFGKMAIEGAEVVHNFSMISQKTGIGIRDLQTLDAAGRTVGVSLDAMVTGFRKFDAAIVGSGKNSGATGIILKNLGVTALDNKEALNQVADAFSKMDDGPRKAADAVALFGRTGLNLIPLLNQGRKGLEEFSRIVDEYGPKIGEDAVKANEAYMVSNAKLGLAWDSFKVDIEAKVLPSITKMITMMADAMHATHNLGDEFTGHFAESMKSFAAGAADASKHSGWLAHLAGPAGELVAMAAGGIGGVSAAADSHGPSKQDQEAAELSRKKAALLAATAKQEQAEKLVFLAIKDGGQAAEKLRVTKEQIAMLTTEEHPDYKTAGELQKQIPALERAAMLEKKRNDYLLARSTMDVGKTTTISDMVAKVREEAAAQEKLAESITSTSSSRLLDTAMAKGQKQVDDELRALNTEEVAIRQKMKADGLGAYADKDPRILQIAKLRDELKTAAPEIIQSYEEIAVASKINAAVDAGISAGETYREQNNALQSLGKAYETFGASIQSAQIETKLVGEKKAAEEARTALAGYIARNGEGAAGVAAFQNAVKVADEELVKNRALLVDNAAQEFKNKIDAETLAIKAETAAWEINARAALSSSAAQREAAAQAVVAKARVENPNASEESLQKLHDNELTKLNQIHAMTILNTAAQHNLNMQYQEEMTTLAQAKALLTATGADTISIDAAIFDAQDKLNRQWDTAAIKVGDFQHKTAGILNEMVQDGKNFWGNFAADGLKAIGSLNDSLAQMLTTGKGNFKQVLQSFEQSTLKNSLQTVEGGLAKKLLGGTGLDKLLPGMGGKADGSTEAMALWVQMAGQGVLGGGGGGLGGLLGGGGSSSDSGSGDSGGGGLLGGIIGKAGGFFSKIGSFFGGFMADGGAVSPGKAYVVGENHPELFMPGTHGSIVPTVQTGKQQVTQMSVHFHGVTDADSFKKSQTQIAAMFHRQASMAYSRTGS